MNGFERRFGNFSIRNLTAIIIIGRIAGFLLKLFSPQVFSYLLYDPVKIMHGEIWRLFTFMFISQSSIFWILFEILFLYWIGTALENIWGSFRYTMYFLGSILGIAAATAILYFTFFNGLDFSEDVSNMIANSLSGYLSGLFIYTLFLPFAWYYADQEIRLMMILPIKVKYLAIFDVFLIALMYYNTFGPPPILWILLTLSMINLLVFFAVVLINRGKQKKRYMGFKHKINKAERDLKKNAMHRCSICGVTEIDDPGMSFRYCSKCEGDHEFCEKHLQNHEHFKKVIDINRFQ